MARTQRSLYTVEHLPKLRYFLKRISELDGGPRLTRAFQDASGALENAEFLAYVYDNPVTHHQPGELRSAMRITQHRFRELRTALRSAQVRSGLIPNRLALESPPAEPEPALEAEASAPAPRPIVSVRQVSAGAGSDEAGSEDASSPPRSQWRKLAMFSS